MQRIEKVFAGRRLIIETGRMAKQAAGSAVVTFGDTMVLAAVTVSDRETALGFFPLLVEYREKTYAAGKIPGGFIKREGRPHDHEILAARIIDRSIRPLFPEGFKNEVQVYVYVISGDQENDSDVLGLIAASYALASSKIPWNGPVAGIRVGRVQEKWVLNPTFQQLAYSDMEVVIAGTADSINMVEVGCIEVTEADMLEAITLGHKGIKELIGYQQELLKLGGSTPKTPWTKAGARSDLVTRLEAEAESRIVEAIDEKDKHTRIQAVEEAKKTVAALLTVEKPEWAPHVGNLLGDIEYNALRSQ